MEDVLLDTRRIIRRLDGLNEHEMPPENNNSGHGQMAVEQESVQTLANDLLADCESLMDLYPLLENAVALPVSREISLDRQPLSASVPMITESKHVEAQSPDSKTVIVNHPTSVEVLQHLLAVRQQSPSAEEARRSESQRSRSKHDKYETPSSHENTQLSSPAHLQHLQDLEHLLSIKTLALQTLQVEYDALLPKLERQRIKCATLEKKSEASDIEINSLTDERERLLTKVEELALQVEELTKGKDDALRDVAESRQQYIRMVQMMANPLLPLSLSGDSAIGNSEFPDDNSESDYPLLR